MRRHRIVAGVLFTTLLVGSLAWGAKLILKDGTTVEGTVTRNGDDYSVKDADGTVKTVAVSDVKEFVFDTTHKDTPPAGASGTPAAPAADTAPAFRAVVNRANSVNAALSAVAIWQEFIDKNPDSTDLPAANVELKKWKTLADQNGEKINGKWVGGEERKKIINEADALTREGIDMFDKNQTLKAVDKLQQSAKIYPNAYLPPFVLGHLAFAQHNYDTALQYFQTSYKLKPQAVEAINNLAVAQGFKNRWDLSIELLYQAAQIRDNKIIAQNLLNSFKYAPPNVRTLSRMKPMLETAHLLATKYQVNETETFLLMPIPPSRSKTNPGSSAGDEAPTTVWSGTGFFINTEGLIITNRHVVKDAKTLLITHNGEQSSADVVVIDDEQDLALIKIKPKGTLPFIRFAADDLPHEGADCVVMGYPLPDRLGSDIKVTRGIVSSSAGATEEGADVLTDAKVNPGNSGGPILDKFGNVIAIVSMKSLASATEDSYGIGISSGHIRKFLTKNKITPAKADPAAKAMSTEDVVTKMKPATVWIIATK